MLASINQIMWYCVFWRSKLSFWKVKITSMRNDRDDYRPIIVAAHHLRSDMI